MAEFDDIRKDLAARGAAREAAARVAFVARERQRRVGRQIERRARTGGERGGDDELQRLRQREKELAAETRRHRDELVAAHRAEAAALVAFAPFTDPRQNLGRLDDRHPILLLPVRLETRFKRAADGRQQLWVRVYPDDIGVDTFEAVPAEVEVQNVRRYWIQVWRAGGDDGEKRAAWSSLARSHGAGRAFWLQQQVRPANIADEPVRAPGELVLVVVATPPLPAAERDPVAGYWRAVWLANGDAAAVAAADAELNGVVGAARADVIRADYAPQNLDERPPQASGVQVAFVELPEAAAIDTQHQPWASPARAALLPERFVLIGERAGEAPLEALGNPIPADLVVGPNPSAPPEEQMRIENDDLIVPEPMRWMVDFDQAIAKGMAFRIDLTPAQAAGGFDRLFVVGVRFCADLAQSRASLETLIRHHQASRKGLAIARQGTPTNNTETDPSGYSWVEDPDAAYDHYFGNATTDDPDDWRTRRDGRWLAEAIGVDPVVLRDSPNYFATDQRDARAMNTALWPATLGYFMDRMMAPTFDEATIDDARAYFTRYVSGRGPVPAIRVGAQPYGILPTAPFSRLRWSLPRERGDDGPRVVPAELATFVGKLYPRLLKVDADWATLQSRVAFVGKPGVDPQQTLLDVVGLHPTSAEFHRRWAQTSAQLFNLFKLLYVGFGAAPAVFPPLYGQSGVDLLRDFGRQFAEGETPEILTKFFTGSANRLTGPLVEDGPPSETAALRAACDDGSNYLDWLIAAATTSHDALRRQDGFVAGRPPRAMLYLLLQHALDLAYVDTGLLLKVNAGLMSATDAAVARLEPAFLHIQAAERDRGSPWRHLYEAQPAITGSPDRLLGEHVAQILPVLRPFLHQQVEALRLLEQATTARLERALVEHIDCCSYRYDAWRMGLMGMQLQHMQNPVGRTPEGQPAAAVGAWIGAFAWLEDLRPENKQLTPVRLAPDLEATFARPGEPALVSDSTNQGHMLAPSLRHAVTAAVLRNGYAANATPATPDLLAINLTSERVRVALGLIQGIRNGQSLAALLGYRLERGLHDRSGLFLDDIIFELRKAFPLVANQTETTKAPPGTPIEAIEARNVVDGLALVEHVTKTGNKAYPFARTDLPPIPDATRRAAIDAEVARLCDVRDAVSDLALAEGVHQAVQGNYDRAAGTFDAYSKGNFPPLPDVIETPRDGVTLTHRIAMHFEGGLDPASAEFAGPRAKGEPAIARWLATFLPPPAEIVARVAFVDAAGTAATPLVSAQDVGLDACELLYMVAADATPAVSALDDAILHHVHTTLGSRADSAIEVRYTEAVAGKVTFFELAALVRSLRALLLKARPLRPSDAQLQGEATKVRDAEVRVRPEKLTEVDALLAPVDTQWQAVAVAIAATLAGPDESTIVAQAVADIETRIAEFHAAAIALDRFGFARADIGTSLEWRRGRYVALAAKLETLQARWSDKLADFDARLLAYDALDPATGDDERIALLAQLERVLSTSPLAPPPATPAAFRTHVTGVVRPAFVAAAAALASARAATTLAAMHTSAFAMLPAVALHDAAPFDLDEERRTVRVWLGDLLARAESTVQDIAKRRADATQLLAAGAGESPARQVEAATRAARRLLDPDFVILPEFVIEGDAATELASAYAARAELLTYLTTDLGKIAPVDEWLYGIARVREKMAEVESCAVLGEALNGATVSLEPLQLPFRAQDRWLGAEYQAQDPSGDPFVVDGEKLLYTAHFVVPLDVTATQCGLLLDEWTELVPAREQTAALTFHYDRPSSEPPQTLLLVMPAAFSGAWQWVDLLDSLRETLEFAKRRAVEPSQIDDTSYARFLPAVLASVSRHPIVPMLNFAFTEGIQFGVKQP